MLLAQVSDAATPGSTGAASNLAVAACAVTQTLRVGGGELRLQFDPADFTLASSQICAWTERSAQAVAAYFDGFPVPQVRVVFKPVDSAGIPTGSTYGYLDGKGPVIFIELGRRATQAALDRDWVLPHELTHLAVPRVPEASHWLEEGIASYVEPVARAQLGHLSREKVWADLLDGLPKGLPQAGDRGLDRTPTWGRTYWGGALFCLLADVQIRERTQNRMGLRDALRGVREAGGSIEQVWTAASVLEAGDRAVGVPVLTQLYAEMATRPGVDNLEIWWQRLGISRSDTGVTFSADAPLAAVRDAITAPDPVAPSPMRAAP